MSKKNPPVEKTMQEIEAEMVEAAHAAKEDQTDDPDTD